MVEKVGLPNQIPARYYIAWRTKWEEEQLEGQPGEDIEVIGDGPDAQ